MGPIANNNEAKQNGFITLVGYLRWYLKEACNYRYLALLLVFVAATIYVNYYVLGEEVWIDRDPNMNRRLFKYIAGYLVIYGGAFALQILTDPKDKRLRDWRLWAVIVGSVVFFSIRAWFYQHQPWVIAHVDYLYQNTAMRIGTNLVSLFWLTLPCAIYWFFVDKKRVNLYGFKAKGVTLWPYFILLIGMLPLLYWAAQQPDFQAAYPRAKSLYLDGTPHKRLGTALYELAYATDFVVTEFFFRGFLIIALARFVGPKTILPMCAFYVSIHFEKPIGETISSFFGGFILGVLAYRTESIYGGIIVHLGIAMLMELAGTLF